MPQWTTCVKDVSSCESPTALEPSDKEVVIRLLASRNEWPHCMFSCRNDSFLGFSSVDQLWQADGGAAGPRPTHQGATGD